MVLPLLASSLPMLSLPLRVVCQPAINQQLALETPLIGTHDGTFHCDEALAIAMLTLLPEYSESMVLRSRNSEYLSKCSIVVDVGAVCDPTCHRYDHHQREFTGTFSEDHKVKLSSAGLVYKYFGERIIHRILSDSSHDVDSSQLVDVLYTKVYDAFIQHIDGIDNGVEVAEGELKYIISTTLSSRVGKLNPSWNEDQSSEYANEQFLKAVALTGSEFIDHVNDMILRWWPARSILQKAIQDRFTVHSSGQIIILEQFCPWQSHLFDIETEVWNFSNRYFFLIDSVVMHRCEFQTLCFTCSMKIKAGLGEFKLCLLV